MNSLVSIFEAAQINIVLKVTGRKSALQKKIFHQSKNWFSVKIEKLFNYLILNSSNHFGLSQHHLRVFHSLRPMMIHYNKEFRANF